jgi:NAD dependent epimerase/dehydratase family enzyme
LLFGKELTETLLLGGQRVLPKALLRSGYEFRHETLEAALRDLLDRH